MNRIEQVLKTTKTYCNGIDNVLLGFLFGSYARQKSSKESDIDIAVYFDKENEKLEIKMQNDLEKLLKKQVDLVILNRAPATLSWNILRKGIPLTIKNRGLYLDFLLDVSTEAEDFFEFNFDTWRKKYGTTSSR